VTVTLYDPRCHELAEHFLGDDERTSEADHERRIQSLALAIQQAVEDWCEAEPAPGTVRSVRCTECRHVFSATDLAAESPTAWGHPYFADGPQIRPGVTQCESYRETYEVTGGAPIDGGPSLPFIQGDPV
jgi:hypothetical protein